ncbi:uncharacterized protein SCODWIG_00029 [Saccharomycodes ludwigii]|uniref:LrgB-like protein n=1 Tax=Saccharomycodes ludwigii TaxID=36035 RepID=A0A376B0R2_9ASCO|nr:uncharacterized protein SCODWIG_00029 [Saccharomycodes ludwigii]
MKEQQEEDDEERRENESLISGLAEQNDGANSNNNLFEGLDMENSRLLETYEPAAIKRSNTWNSIYNTNSKNKYTHYYDENVDDDNISLVNLASHTNLDYDMASFPPTDINHVDKSIKGVDGEKAYVKYNSLSFANDNLKNASILDFIKRQQKKYYNPEIVCKRAEIQQEQYSTDSRTTNANTARNNNINNYYIDEDLAISEEREKNAKIMLFWESHFHHFVYFIAWFTIGIWTYYFTSYVMPFQLFTLICTFMLVTDFIPSTFKYKRILHPVLCSVALSLLVFLISALINNRGEISFFLKDLKHFQTGRNYLKLFKDKQKGIQYWPGAGDFFSSCMDVSITALSIPMYSYRKDLYYNAHVMLPPIFIFTIGNLFLYPLISHKIGISPENSIGYMGRSITLALGTPAITNFNGNVTVMAVTTVVTGVLGVLIGDRLMKVCRIPVEDDPVIRGLTLGCNCTAIATAYLLGIDVRAAAISSLSFVVYGTIMVVLSCIAPVVKFVDVTLAGMA